MTVTVYFRGEDDSRLCTFYGAKSVHADKEDNFVITSERNKEYKFDCTSHIIKIR